MTYDATKVKDKLKEFLNREPSVDEIENGKNDVNIISRLMFDDLLKIKNKLGI